MKEWIRCFWAQSIWRGWIDRHYVFHTPKQAFFSAFCFYHASRSSLIQCSFDRSLPCVMVDSRMCLDEPYFQPKTPSVIIPRYSGRNMCIVQGNASSDGKPFSYKGLLSSRRVSIWPLKMWNHYWFTMLTYPHPETVKSGDSTNSLLLFKLDFD